MGHDAGDLHQEQALVGGGAVEAAALEVVGEGDMIPERIVSAQGKLEAVLALLRAVADA